MKTESGQPQRSPPVSASPDAKADEDYADVEVEDIDDLLYEYPRKQFKNGNDYDY